MELTKISEAFPRLFHMAEAGSWLSIQQHGLLSTYELLNLFEVSTQETTRLTRSLRREKVRISHPRHGEAVLRDQGPMSEGGLKKSLTDMTIPEWLEKLNSHVFFWLTEKRLERFLTARPYRDLSHDVLIVDTASLLEDHGEHVLLAPINTGSTIFNPQPRGHKTFLPIPEYPFEQWKGKRGIEDAVVELVIPVGLYEVEKYVIRVEQRRGRTSLGTVWSSQS